MKYSDIALKIWAAKECGILKTNAQFWNNYSNRDKFEKEISKDERVLRMIEKISYEIETIDDENGFICIFDSDFPIISEKVKNNSEKPFLLFYRGNLALLKDLNKNVAVIGLIDPDIEIEKRESEVVEALVKNNLIVVSGLAMGCDKIAHEVCLKSGGKTIAILPTQLNKIYPVENRELADEIVKNGGLLITEYYKEASTKYEAINRFIERDRLQAMFSKAIILIASYRKGEGDSGSRHAMEFAKKYGIERYVMYNKEKDENNKRFGLNKDLLNDDKERVKILQKKSINDIKSYMNPYLSFESNSKIGEQMTLL